MLNMKCIYHMMIKQKMDLCVLMIVLFGLINAATGAEDDPVCAAGYKKSIIDFTHRGETNFKARVDPNKNQIEASDQLLAMYGTDDFILMKGQDKYFLNMPQKEPFYVHHVKFTTLGARNIKVDFMPLKNSKKSITSRKVDIPAKKVAVTYDSVINFEEGEFTTQVIFLIRASKGTGAVPIAHNAFILGKVQVTGCTKS